jgi:septum formation protein
VPDAPAQLPAETSPLPRLILASRSPQRIALLSEAGYQFAVEPADIDETAHPPDLLPAAVAMFLATAKAAAVAQRFPNDLVLAADTVVALGDMLLGKPRDAEDATRMLNLLSGTTHIVITGVALHCKKRGIEREQRAMSAVSMDTLGDREIAHYVASGQWQGKAGGYGIQDQDINPAGNSEGHRPFVQRLVGSHTNVVGMPMTLVRAILLGAGIQPTPPSA